MKNFIVLLFLVPLFCTAQKTHTVQAKETLYSLARQYNVHPRELASFNNIPVTTSLSVGQVIKIPTKTTMAPLTVPPPSKTEVVEKKEVVEKVEKKEPVEKVEKKEPVTKTAPVAKKEGSTPVYHKVGKKETLYHISKLYNNVSIDDLKKWNKLTSDGLSEGMNLIVGYGNQVSKKPAEEVVAEKKAEEIKPQTKEITKAPEPVKKETTKTPEPEKKEVVKIEPKKEETREVSGKNFNGGAFKNLYEKQVNDKANVAEQKGPAGTFKSTSGWEDGKYYCLTNTAPAGSIVKVTNPANQKYVYAKVLDLMPDLKQNEGVIIRISNAAASELGTGAENFESTINF